MKKFISMVMTAAMVASLVPATAFAKATDYGIKASASVVGPWTKNEKAFDGQVTGSDVPELQLKVTEEGRYNTTGEVPEVTFDVRLDNATFKGTDAELKDGVSIWLDGANIADSSSGGTGTAPSVGAPTYDWVEQDLAAVKNLLNKYYFQNDKTAFDGYVVENPAVGGSSASSNPLNDAAVWAKLVTEADGKLTEKSVNAQIEDALKDAQTKNMYGMVSGDTVVAYPKDYVFQKSYAGNNNKPALVKMGANVKGDTFIDWATFLNDQNNGAEFKAQVMAGSTSVKTIDEWMAVKTKSGASTVGQDLTTALTTNKVCKEIKQNGKVNYDTAIKVVSATTNADKDVLTVVLAGFLRKDTVIGVDLTSVMDKTGRDALVSVTSDMVNANDLAYVKVADKGITASIQKVEKVAEDEVKELHNSGITIKETVDNSYKEGDEVTLRLNSGFEFVEKAIKVGNGTNTVSVKPDYDGNIAKFVIPAGALKAKTNEWTIYDLEVEATSAKSGSKATVEIKIADLDKVKVEVLEVVDYKVVMSVDKDKEVPVYYSGVDAKDTGLTSNEDHESLEVTVEETFPGAWSSRKGFTITVPDGVYVTDVRVKNVQNFQKGRDSREDFTAADWNDAFVKAYQDGDHKNFEFDKRVFNDVDTQLQKKAATMTFVLTLVADYEFEGDVKIGLEGETIGKVDPVVVAKFEKPYTVEAEQNDLKIDARQTKLDKNIVIKEAADGLWDKKTEFVLGVEKDLIAFEEGAKFEVSKDSGLEIKDHFTKDTKDTRAHMSFDVKSVGDKKADVTISNIGLFMERNIPQGEYGLELTGTLRNAYLAQKLFAPDDANVAADKAKFGDKNLKDDNFVDDVTDSSATVNAKFINVITARRDEDGFTTRIAVPVGETYIFAGVDKLEGAANSMEVPAYINKDNYTMLPLRAVARALGIANGNIYWNQATQTATVQYGNSRIMTFKLGAKEMIINGHSMPAVAGIEMTNNRLFLSLRDLGVAMNVPAEKIAWDSKTKTAYLNPTDEDVAAIKG